MGTMIKFRVLMFTALLSLSTGCAEKEEAISIAAEAASDGLLRFSLTNNYHKELSVKTRQVPWTSSAPYPLAVSVHVFDTETNRARTSERAGVFGNDVLDEIEIEPGDRITGEVNLMGRFHDPDTESNGGRYIAHWTYSLPICDLGKTFVHIGAAENDGQHLRIIYQGEIVTSSPPRCED